MAILQVTVPDALVPRILAALTARYPELAGGTAAQVGRGGVRLLLREVLAQEEEAAVRRTGFSEVTTDAEAARVAALAAADAIT